MNPKHIPEDLLVTFHYGDAAVADRAAIEQHLAACDACRAGLEELRGVLDVVSAQPVPDRAADFERRIWQRIEPRLAERPASWWSFVWQPQKLALAGALAALLVVTFLAGRHSLPGGTPRPREPLAEVNPSAREQLLLAAVGEHFERSQRMLTELANAPEGRRVDISSEQQSADDLVLANRLYRQTAAQSGETRLVLLLDELERTLLEISHSPQELTRPELDRLRKRITRRELLFKLRVLGQQVREQEQEKIRARSRQTF